MISLERKTALACGKPTSQGLVGNFCPLSASFFPSVSALKSCFIQIFYMKKHRATFNVNQAKKLCL